MRAKSFEVASETVKQSLLKLDAYHKEFQEDTWVKGIKTKLIVNLSRIENEYNIS